MLVVWWSRTITRGVNTPERGKFNVRSVAGKENVVPTYMHMQMSAMTYIKVYFLFLSPKKMYITSHVMFYIPNTFSANKNFKYKQFLHCPTQPIECIKNIPEASAIK